MGKAWTSIGRSEGPRLEENQGFEQRLLAVSLQSLRTALQSYDVKAAAGEGKQRQVSEAEKGPKVSPGTGIE